MDEHTSFTPLKLGLPFRSLGSYELYPTETGSGVYTINPENSQSINVTDSLKNQLSLQQDLYTFFGTAPFKELHPYLLFIPKGSIFFHGDNINEGEMLFSKLDLVEKVTLTVKTGEVFYQYKINKINVSYDSPIINIVTKTDGVEVVNSVTQASALLSKASHLRLISNIKNANENTLKEIATSEWSEGKTIYIIKPGSDLELLQLYQDIDKTVQFIYDTSVNGLIEKSKIYDVFVKPLKNTQNNGKKLITQSLLETEEKRLEEKINLFEGDSNIKNKITTYYANSKSISMLLSKPQDEIIKPPAKTQFFGNPIAETNIVLSKGSPTATVKSDSKYLYTMQVYMFQKDVYLLDYTRLRFVFDHPLFKKTLVYGNYTGIDKRSLHWGSYFKSDENASKKTLGTYTYPFKIKLGLKKLNLTKKINNNMMMMDDDGASSVTSDQESIYSTNSSGLDIVITDSSEKLDAAYTKLNDVNSQGYILRNRHPKEDSPIATHLNYILNLRGMSVNIQGYTDFDPAETYIHPTFIHERIKSLAYNPNIMGTTNYGRDVICREYNVFNSPQNLLYLCYASTLPNYKAFNQLKNEAFFTPNGLLTRSHDELDNANEECANTDKRGDEEMFVDFTNINLFDQTGNIKKILLVFMTTNLFMEIRSLN